MATLDEIFGEVSRMIPEGPAGEAEHVFGIHNLPCPPTTLSATDVFVRRTYHDYNSWFRAERLQVFVEQKVARQLGVFLLACVFHNPKQACLELPEHERAVRRIFYRGRNRDYRASMLSTKPISFSYFPSSTIKHPWAAISGPVDLPLLALSNEDEAVYAEDDWQRRDVVFVESSPLGTTRLAELLLNAGCTWNQIREYELEGEAGFRGVAPLSSEVQIFLPGSDGWAGHPHNRRTTST